MWEWLMRFSSTPSFNMQRNPHGPRWLGESHLSQKISCRIGITSWAWMPDMFAFLTRLMFFSSCIRPNKLNAGSRNHGSVSAAASFHLDRLTSSSLNPLVHVTQRNKVTERLQNRTSQTSYDTHILHYMTEISLCVWVAKKSDDQQSSFNRLSVYNLKWWGRRKKYSRWSPLFEFVVITLKRLLIRFNRAVLVGSCYLISFSNELVQSPSSMGSGQREL
jgi:hypothetical protein